jgi:cytochrome c oxidase accessory protein FixG
MSLPPVQEDPERTRDPAAQEINWRDFRDHLSTADAEGRRVWLYPRQPRGRFYRWRTWVSWALLALMFAGPFIRIDGNPLLMLNIVERKFSILGRIFWPQDFAIFAVALLLFLTGIAVFTAAFGRLWCGWACPQTVLMEMVFRKIEYFLEGDAQAQKALDRGPWTARRVGTKALKHLVFLALSFLIGNTLLSYIVGSDALIRIITDDPRQHLTGLGFMVLFTLVFYGIFARFREQACTFICPYGRFQSTLIDENTIVVAYDHKRGEERSHARRGETQRARGARGAGDCVDCHQCVAVCPTGIDIRNGVQMECVHCTACIDACDAVMDRLGWKRGLIRYASLNGIESGQRLRVTPRIMGYTALLVVLGLLLGVLLLSRSDVDTSFLRAPGALFQQLPDGRISNLYLLKLTNKTSHEIPVELQLESPGGGTLKVLGNRVSLAPQEQSSASVLVELPASALHGGEAQVVVSVRSGSRLLQRVRSAFVGPLTAPSNP